MSGEGWDEWVIKKEKKKKKKRWEMGRGLLIVSVETGASRIVGSVWVVEFF
jgi:hypothetical protein